MNKLFTNALVKELEVDGKKEKLFVASDSTEDRQGEVISIDGWQLDNFKKNPVLLWGHDQNRPSVGVAEKIGYKTIDGRKSLVFEPKFHKKDEFSRLVAELVDEGWIKMTSVGFMPLEMTDNTFTKQELLEISFVNVPANPNAIGLAMSKGFSAESIKKAMPEAKIPKKIENVIAYKKYPHAAVDNSWNADAEIKDASVADLKAISAWHDGENDGDKSVYKFIHHTIDGYKTDLAGCKSAMAELFTDTSLSDADREAVYDHLAKHYIEFGIEPPKLKTAKEIVAEYAESESAKDQVAELRKTVNNFVEEVRAENLAKKELAEANTQDFKNNLLKMIEDINLNVAGLQEGITPGDKGLEKRFSGIEKAIETLSNGIIELVKNSSSGEQGREPVKAVKSEDPNRRTAIKVLNRAVEALNILEK